jgi:SPRY domain
MTSFAFDGYRNVTWHRDRKKYGELWNIGDVVGCGLNLDEGKIEWFLNGKSLGIAYTEVPVGENIAYFPGVSLSSDEKITFNFGKSPFFYSYENYESYDIPLSLHNGLVEITAELLDLLSNNILRRLQGKDILPYYKMTFTNKIFNFLANYSFSDDFVLKTLIIPFLCKLQRENPQFISLFFEHIFIYLDSNQKILFNLNFFDSKIF